MLLSGLSFVSILFVFLSFGIGIEKLLSQFSNQKTSTQLVPTIILGMIGLVALLRIIHFIIPIDHKVFAVVFILSLVIALWQRHRFIQLIRVFLTPFLQNKIFIILLVMLLGFIALRASLLPGGYDVGLYHMDAIRWIESYKVIPGLGNLHSRLAFNSNIHLLNAFFGLSGIFGTPLHTVNGFLVGLLVVACLHAVMRLKVSHGKLYLSQYFGLFFFIFLLVSDAVKRDFASPMTDVPAAVLSMFLVLIGISYHKRQSLAFMLVLILLPLTVMTIKLSALPLVLISAYFFFRHPWQSSKEVASVITAGILLLVPYFLSNVVLSGYFVYPISATRIESVDWVLQPKIAEADRQWVRSWSINPGVSNDVTRSQSTLTNYLNWFKKRNISQSVVLLSLASVVVLGVANHQRLKKMYSGDHVHLAVFTTAYVAGLLFWFLTAPDFRFSYGYFGSVIALLSFPLFKPWLNKLFKPDHSFVLLGSKVMIVAILVSILLKYNRQQIFALAFKQVEYETFELQKEYLSDDFFVYIPVQYDRTGYTGFPGTSYTQEGLSLRGEEVVDGFWIDESKVTQN